MTIVVTVNVNATQLHSCKFPYLKKKNDTLVTPNRLYVFRHFVLIFIYFYLTERPPSSTWGLLFDFCKGRSKGRSRPWLSVLPVIKVCEFLL